MLNRLLAALRDILSALTGAPYSTLWVKIPTLVVGSAYTSGDAFGLSFKIQVPKKGIFYSAEVLDFDNEKLGIDFVMFDNDLESDTADDTAWAMARADATKYQTTVSVTAGDFTAASANAVASVGSIGKAYVAPKGELTVKAVIRGAANIAAAADKPMVRFRIL